MTASRRTIWVVAVLGVAGALLGAWLLVAWRSGRLSPRGPGAGPLADGVAPSPAGDARRIHASLFYVSDTGDVLVPVDREVLYAPTPAEQARRIVEAQVAAPPAGHVSPIPAGTTVRSVFLTSRGDAFVDVSREIMTGHPGGSLNEFLTVYAIVNALTVNLPDISAVQVLVDGREVETLIGHMDLRHPVGRGTRWVRRTP